MDIVVCVKRIPDTSEAVDIIEIDDSRKGIKQSNLIFKMNDWDEYALEEAIQLKENLGSTVTAISVGPEECDETLRRALAMGADRAIRIDEDTSSADSYVVARILTALICSLPHDLVFFGMQSQDTGRGQLGPMVAELLKIPHAVGVTKLQIQDGQAKVSQELEGGTLALYYLELPALLTIQTGINKPRYVSFLNIRKARNKELKVTTLDELGLARDALIPRVKLEKLDVPLPGKGAKMIAGSAQEEATGLANLLRELGILK